VEFCATDNNITVYCSTAVQYRLLWSFVLLIIISLYIAVMLYSTECVEFCATDNNITVYGSTAVQYRVL
jgi:hypothetical protein